MLTAIQRRQQETDEIRYCSHILFYGYGKCNIIFFIFKITQNIFKKLEIKEVKYT